MRCLASSIVALGAAVAAVCGPALAQDQPGPFAIIPTTNLMDAGGYVIVSSLDAMPNGNLICIFFAQRPHAANLGVTIGSDSAILGRISEDCGKTWGPAFLVLDSPPDGSNGDSSLVVAGDKVIVIVSCEIKTDPPYQRIHLLQVVSEDNGRTWSKPTRIPIPRSRPAVSGRAGITLADGTILMPYWWDYIAQTKAPMEMVGDIPCVSGVLISKDGGKTWKPSTDVYGPWREEPRYLVTVDEPTVAAVTDEDILMVTRSVMPSGRAMEAWSHDGGWTWGLPHEGALPGWNSPSALLKMKNGWIARMCDASGNVLRFPLAVSISRDGGLIWSKPRVLVDFPEGSGWPTQASYPSVVEASDGSLVATWCQCNPDGRWFLASGRFAPEWALGP